MSTFTYVQSSSAQGVASRAYGSNTGAGALLIACHYTYTGAVPSALTDTQSNTWRRGNYCHQGSQQMTIWFAVGTAGGANTVSQNGDNSSNSGFAVLEYTPPASFTIAALEQVVATASVSALSTGGGTRLLNPALILMMAADQSGNHTWAGTTGVTVRETVNVAVNTVIAEATPASVALGGTYGLTWTGPSSNVGLFGLVATADPPATGGGLLTYPGMAGGIRG